MKRIIAILTAVLMVASCASYRDIKILSTKLEGLSIFSRPATATVALEIENPTVTLDFVDVTGILKVDGAAFADVECEPFVLKGHSTEIYHLTLTFELDEDIALSQIVKLFKSDKAAAITADVFVEVKDPLGIRHRKMKKDVKLWEKSLEYQQ